MKTIILNKKRDGQDWKQSYDYLTNDIETAKKDFTEGVKTDLANDESFIYINDEIWKEIKDRYMETISYTTPGYYRHEGTGTDVVYDNELIECYSDDVYHWRLKSINIID